MEPGLVQKKGFLNKKVRRMNRILREYCKSRMITYRCHDNIYVKTQCNFSDLHLYIEGVQM